MGPPRLRLRSLMLGIGTIGLFLGWWFGYKRMNDRAVLYRGLAARAAHLERHFLKSAEVYEWGARREVKQGRSEPAERDFKLATADRALAAKAAALRRTYDRCVQRPWITPPPPDSFQKLDKESYAVHSPYFKIQPLKAPR